MSELMQLANEVRDALLGRPGILLGLVVFVILVIRDFRGVAIPLIRRAIEEVEMFLETQSGQEKLTAAVNYVLDFLPMPYKLLVPRMLVVKMVQAVFNRDFAVLFSRAKRTVLLRPTADPLPQPNEDHQGNP